ncbi:MBL fold metallo-hydrolase [Longimicrobium terrae]|uniref:L-ascorbate metabolism protein UlaG (Beta-lactamase superfamily) n=1 Tax=Longimicrobium terrae TaxID=1639882 RepID=A0A841H1D6_9BACT|nr:MBL fold metallo-hydrolase [Longimicrobium terrae]MBB4637528.1 L-ascorbate metabolism protein UlaG (beta-lactamase superfamily) [Longimicrobium terrae]MBB6071925.1 L-ascorbate metabolism protein UlaG (beta-lactamase superfamily) [Longimicrobium terrae]NNC30472.1 MBL fold metallo-hydrolase [Longimicrobium terrae]
MIPTHPRNSVRWLAGAGILTGLFMAQGCIRSPLAHPSITSFKGYTQPALANTSGSDAPALTVRFMGASSLLFTDRDGTSILMDGFVSRPGMLRVGIGRIRPNCGRIRQAHTRLGEPNLAAVFAGHAHYDHAMDAPVWAQMSGATLVGSRSVTMLGRGIGLPDSQDVIVREGIPIQFGRFELTFIESVHGLPDRYPGTVYEPFEPPAKTTAWQTGLVYSVFVRHRGRSILVQSTAGYKPGALRGRRADVVYLAIGGLGRQPLSVIDTYWTEVVRATGARRVILVHWDDFFRGLDEPLLPTIYGGDDVPRSMGRIAELAAADSVQVLIPPVWDHTDPFQDLPGLMLTDTVPRGPDTPTFHPPAPKPYCSR